MGQYIFYNGELYHAGVKGMKWGKRKASKKTSKKSSRKALNLIGSEDYRRAHKPKAARYMSDKELSERNKRLSDELKYKELKKKSSKGRKVVKVILKTAGVAAVTSTVITAGAIYAGKKALSSGANVAGFLNF